MAIMRTKRKRNTKKKTRNDHPIPAPGIPALPPAIQSKRNSPMNRPRRIDLAGVRVLILVLAASLGAQEAPPAALARPAQDSSSKADKSSRKQYSHLHDFLIRGTVFNEKALSFPDVELRLRKEGEKKYKWETYTNSRGEFAVRVPQGSNYEILVHVKGFTDQTKTVEAKGGGNEEALVFRMQPVTGDAK
jgi:hypothetical protein